mmetsp:Transcript_14481/g.16726  ORF Transcript_14481/g.16726 Transcript_14481/m.16726 type:complete len:114 (-) Transcript_14481:102-443(-)
MKSPRNLSSRARQIEAPKQSAQQICESKKVTKKLCSDDFITPNAKEVPSDKMIILEESSEESVKKFDYSKCKRLNGSFRSRKANDDNHAIRLDLGSDSECSCHKDFQNRQITK